MTVRFTRRAFVGAAAATTLAAPTVLRAAEPLKFRWSLDTAPSHPRNQAVVDYVGKLEKASNGALKGEVFHSGQLFADLNVSKALLQGQVEMAAPGAWTLTGLVPDCDMVQLPYFYGVPLDVTHKATDGKPGEHINKQLEAKLRQPRARPVDRSRLPELVRDQDAARQVRRPEGPQDPQPGRRRRSPGASSSPAASPTPPPGRTCRWR